MTGALVGRGGAFSGGGAAAESLFICTARGVIPNGVRNLISVRDVENYYMFFISHLIFNS
jgi:hypothetical protein